MQEMLEAGRQAATGSDGGPLTGGLSASGRVPGTPQRPLNAQGLMDLLRDHTGRPDSVCRHPNPALPEEERVETVVSMVEDLTARRFYVAAGTPCTNDFEEIVLSPPGQQSSRPG
jgi:hypothetical protein